MSWNPNAHPILKQARALIERRPATVFAILMLTIAAAALWLERQIYGWLS